MEISCLIVDREQSVIDELRNILSQMKGIEVVDTAINTKEGIAAIRLKEPLLVFLDIKMSARDGFEIIKACAGLTYEPYFVFTIDADQYAVKAFKASAINYIVKPFQPDRIQESMERIRQLHIGQRQGVLCDQLEKLVKGFESLPDGVDKVTVKKKGRLLLLDPGEIILCKAENREIWVYQVDERFKLHGITSLEKLERKLKDHNFFRVHRSALVNLAQVREIAPWINGKYNLSMNDKNSTEILVSRRRVKGLKARLGL